MIHPLTHYPVLYFPSALNPRIISNTYLFPPKPALAVSFLLMLAIPTCPPSLVDGEGEGAID